MDTQLLIGSRFEAGTEAEEHILNPRTGAGIMSATMLHVMTVQGTSGQVISMTATISPTTMSSDTIRLSV